ncbi:MAG: heavy metal translocating P-type ATPase [Sulfurospirillaceae bacterium]|nr:heavy metal translocating P-type ATPase [Sulfurospirillaceae bacterium]
MQKRRCDHCHLEFDEKVLIKDSSFEDSTKYFCCKGCQGVFHLLKSEGLDDFYKRVGNTELEPPKEDLGEVEKFDLEGFNKKYIKNKDGFYEIYLIIEGIHCSACVWLNEKVLHQKDGIVEASINQTNNKAKIVWDPDTIKLSEIILTIRNIGYNAYPYDPSMQEIQANSTRRDYYARLLVGVFTTMNIMWIAIAQYAGYFTGMKLEIKNILNFAEFVLATPTLFYTGSVYFKGAYYGIKNKYVNMDILVATGATSAYIYSLYAMFSQKGEVYFDSVTMIITFVFAGKYLEVLSKKKAVDRLDSFNSSVPTEVLVIKNDEKILLGVEEVKTGDILEVKAGEKIVIDGVIIDGESSFDTSSLTGESTPVFLKTGDKILSGYIALDTVFRYRAICDVNSSVLSKITSLLEDSMNKKPQIEKLANIVSGYFSTIILLLSIGTLLFWYFGGEPFERSLIVAISVIVIACPCALGLATPVSTLVGLGMAAKSGILFKEASFLETMAKCDVLMLDKTGTITSGKPKIVDKVYLKDFDRSLLYSLSKNSTHPISKAIAEYFEEEKFKIKDLQNIKNIEAKGIKATYEGATLYGGSMSLLSENGIKCNSSFEDFSQYYFAINNEVVAVFALEDIPREDAAWSIENIKHLGVEVIMLTGDNKEVAKKICNRVGIEKFYASLLPQEKANIIEEARKNGKKVVMVGDGINDALALSKSEIAITMGSGADIALNVSDVVLINNSFESLYYSFLISKRTFRIVKENLLLSFLYNAITIPLAMAGYVIPLFAALSMSLSSLIVVGNSMRINMIKTPKRK